MKWGRKRIERIGEVKRDHDDDGEMERKSRDFW